MLNVVPVCDVKKFVLHEDVWMCKLLYCLSDFHAEFSKWCFIIAAHA